MASPSTIHQQPFTKTYMLQCFNVWYTAGRPGAKNLKKRLEKDGVKEHDRVPHMNTLLQWRDEQDWDVRGDDLDARAMAVVDDELVNHRVLMLKQMASKGKELQQMGLEWLRDNEFDTSSSAVSAIFKGAELERTSRGISERLVKMLKMSDDKLTERVQKLLDKASESGEIIDVTPVEEELEDA